MTTETFDPIPDEPIRYASNLTLLHRSHVAATEAKPSSKLVRLGS